MGTTGNEQWDHANAIYDLNRGNYAGARWAEQRLSYDERTKGIHSRVSLAFASVKIKDEKWKRYTAKSPITGRPLSVLARVTGRYEGNWVVDIRIIKPGAKGYNDLYAVKRYKASALTPAGAIQKALKHLGNLGVSTHPTKSVSVE